MATFIMNEFKFRAQQGIIDWDNHTFYWVLTNGLAPDIDAHLTLDDIDASEVVGGNYSRQTMAGFSLVKDTVDDRAEISATSPTWANSTITADTLWLVHQAGGAPALTDYLCFAFTFTQASSSNGDFTYTLPSPFYQR